jgi:hypothetical protein
VEYNGIIDVIDLRTRVFVWKAVAQPNEQQIVFVVVQDQTLSPVRDVAVSIAVNWPEGGVQNFSLVTDRNGVAIVPFAVRSQAYGSMVTVTVQVFSPKQEDKAVTSFRVWR